MWAVLLLHPYLTHTRFTIKTNHHSQKITSNLTDNTGRIPRLRLRPSEYEFKKVSCARIKHRTAYVLSSLTTTGENITTIEDYLLDPVANVTEKERDIYIIDATCEERLYLKAEPPLTENTQLSKEELNLKVANDSYRRMAEAGVGHSISESTVDKKRLFIRNSSVDDAKQIVAQSSLRTYTLHVYHYPPIAAYPGQRRVLNTF